MKMYSEGNRDWKMQKFKNAKIENIKMQNVKTYAFSRNIWDISKFSQSHYSKPIFTI